jgi:hypothetical protein
MNTKAETQKPEQKYKLITRVAGGHFWSETFSDQKAAQDAYDWIKGIQSAVDVTLIPDPPDPS